MQVGRPSNYNNIVAMTTAMKLERYCSILIPRAEIKNSIMWPSPSRPCEAFSVGKQSLASTKLVVLNTWYLTDTQWLVGF